MHARNGVKAILDPGGSPARLRFRNYSTGAYDGALPNPTRSTLWASITEARFDLDECTRRELLRRARHLYRNSPVTRALIERLVTLTIGPGLIPVPASASEEWNTAAFTAFLDWAKSPDLQTAMNWWQMQRVVARSVFLDGDIFSYQTAVPETGRPAIQLVESHLVRSPESTKNRTPDGVNLDRIGRPISFTVWESSEDKSAFQKIPARLLIQHLNYERARQYRGASVLATAINTAHDIQDILALEKSAVKSLSARKDVIKNAAGELDVSQAIYDGAAPATATTDQKIEYYKKIAGPETIVLAHGDDVVPWEPKRPSPTWEGFMDFLANTICLSTNLPPSVLLQMKVGGADTRRDLAMAQRVTGNWQQDFASQFQRHYEFVIQAAIESGDLTDPPVDWRQVSWQMPKDLTVDAGREAAQDREDVKMGLMTRREYFGRFQLVAKRETNQFLDEVADILKGAEERGIPPQYIGFGNPNSLPSMPPNSSIRSSSKQEEEQEDEEETREPVLASDE